MKTTKLLLSSLLITMGLNAKPSDLNITENLNTNIKRGTTIGHYAKPGAPIDMSYETKKVDINEMADVNITLTTHVRYGEMNVELNVDDKLEQVSNISEKLVFQLTPNQRTYTINLKVKSTENGLFYIRLLTSIGKGKGSQMRSFAVPVYIGENPKPKTNGHQIQKVMGGENLSISKAVETIEEIEE